MTCWYLRRAVPWPALAGGAVLAGLLMGAAHAWEGPALMMVLLSILVAAAVAAFVLDEPAQALTRVTPRGAAWASVRRYAVGTGTVGAGVLLVQLAPEPVPVADWSLVLVGLAVGGVAVAAWLSLRHHSRPGGTVASVVVLGGLTPLVLDFVVGVNVYPGPELSGAEVVGWTAVVLVGALVAVRAAR